ncbi:MAG: AmmeMemoRadiSam system protein B, partial [Patescibacteria group bacterium]
MRRLFIILLAIGGGGVNAFFFFSVPLGEEKKVGESAKVKMGSGTDFAGAKTEPDPPRISGMVVPHHEIVASRRAEMFRVVGKRFDDAHQPPTIILIGPNHFERGFGWIQTTRQTWSTSAGALEPDGDLIDTLIAQTSVREEAQSFDGEHSI